tara:strand:- start:1148 stop:1879 length:732 start_codon:yes stop_codon:yes gene_type:complete
MIIAIVIGRKGSKGFPGKNIHQVFNKPLAQYSIDVAKKTSLIDRIYLSTDDEELKKIGKKKKIEIIKRPKYLASNKALGEDAFLHAYKYIKKKEAKPIRYFVLLMCNSPTISPLQINKGIKVLNRNKKIDSAVTVSRYNMYSPLRARKINNHGLLDPYLPFKYFGNENDLNCDRDSQGDVWFADMGCSIVRPSCLENIHSGLLPQKWMGKKIYPLKQEAGLDIDYEWQLPQIKWWIKNNKYGE